jgi:hypothetical protein
MKSRQCVGCFDDLLFVVTTLEFLALVIVFNRWIFTVIDLYGGGVEVAEF